MSTKRETYEHEFLITFSIPSRNIAFKPYSLIKFSKKCNYFTDFIPTYELTVEIDDKYIDYLRLYDKEISVTITDTVHYGENANSRTQSSINFIQEFACYFDKNKITGYMDSYKKVSDSIDNAKPAEYRPSMGAVLALHTISFYLFLKDDLKMKTFIHNYVLGSEQKPVSPVDAIGLIVDQNPYVKKCLIDKPENTNKYTDLIVESESISNAIRNVQEIYGIYSKGMVLFYDNETLYILNKYSQDHSYTDGELTNLNILISTRKDAIENEDTVTIDESKGIILYKRFSNIVKEDYEAVNGIFSGNKFVFSNYGTIINSMFANEGKTEFVSPLMEIENPRSARVDVGTKKIVDYDMLNNPYNMSSYMYDKSKGVPIAFTMININPNHFTPNKTITMKFDTEENAKLYGGRYNIESIEFLYTRTPNPVYKFKAYCSALVTLSNKTEGSDKYYEPLPPSNSSNKSSKATTSSSGKISVKSIL